MEDPSRETEPREGGRAPGPGAAPPFDGDGSLRELLHHLPQAVFESDLEGRFTYVNPFGLERFGFTLEDLRRGVRVLELFSPEDRPQVSANIEARMRGEPLAGHEYVLRAKNGSRVPVVVFSSPMLRGGRPAGLRGIVLDITERKRKEETLLRTKEDLERREKRRTDELRRAMAALEQSERYYRELFENAHDAIVIFEPDGETILDVNQRACEIYGFSRAEFVGMSLKALSKDVRVGEERILDTLNRGRFPGFETVQRKKDGSEMVLEINASVVDFKGRRAILSINRDVTERKKAQKNLLESEEKFRAVVEQSWESIYLADIATGRLLEANPAICRMLGYAREELLERTLFDIVAHERSEIEEKIRGILEGGASYLGKRIWKRKDGSAVQVEVSVSRVAWRERMVFCVVARDASERTRMEEEHERLQRQLFQSQKMEAVGLLAGGISHDFNNLITAIMGQAELGLRSDPADEPPGMVFEKILETARRAAALTDQLLLFSRKHPADLRPIDLNRTVTNLLAMLGRVIGEDVTVRPRLAPGLWSVSAHESNVEQVLMNLVVNARDAMPRGGTLTVRTENVMLDAIGAARMAGSRPGEFVCLSVGDSGVGMTEETLQHLFEPFFTTKKPGAGTGLGLSVVYGIVRQHQGWLDVSSAVGKGSNFRVYLPAVHEAPEEAPREDGKPAAVEGSGRRILFVEDDPAIRDFAERALRRSGFRVQTCSSAREAEAAFGEHGEDVDLLLSDMVMPGRTGPDLAEALLARRPSLRVVLTSGYAGDGGPTTRLGDRDVVFLKKPYAFRDLLRAIRRALEPEAAPGT